MLYMKKKELHDKENTADLNIDLDAGGTSENSEENDVVIKEWKAYIHKEIDKHGEQLSKHNYNKFKLDLLKRITRRTDEFAPKCKSCKKKKMKITLLVKNLQDIVAHPNAEHPDYFKQLKEFSNHLQITHKLLKEHQYMAALIIAGLVLGTIAGLIIGQAVKPENYFFAVFASIIIGGGLGAEVERLIILNAKKKDKVI